MDLSVQVFYDRVQVVGLILQRLDLLQVAVSGFL
jgi:hypothetical protein